MSKTMVYLYGGPFDGFECEVDSEEFYDLLNEPILVTQRKDDCGIRTYFEPLGEVEEIFRPNRRHAPYHYIEDRTTRSQDYEDETHALLIHDNVRQARPWRDQNHG